MPKRAKELTPAQIRAIKHPGGKLPVKVAVGGVAGLMIQVTPSGAKSWVLRTRYGPWTENGTIGGRRVIESSHATEGQLYFGLWQHAYIGMWSGLDLIIDPYTNASTGIVNIVASQLADVAVAHPTAFTAVTLGA